MVLFIMTLPTMAVLTMVFLMIALVTILVVEYCTADSKAGENVVVDDCLLRS